MGGGKVLLLNVKWSEHEQKSLAVFKYEMLYRYNIINHLIFHILTMQMWREGTNRSHWAPHTALCSPCKQKTQIQTLINYIFTVGVAGGASVNLQFWQTNCPNIFFTKYAVFTLAFTSNF